MKRGVYSEHLLRGEIEFALQYGPSREWTAALLAAEMATPVGEVEREIADLIEEGYVTRRGDVVRWN